MGTDHRAKLRMHLLGAPHIECDGTDVAERLSAKAQALLYYLAMTGRTHTRAALAGLLWGERSEVEARSNLRKAIQQLRRHFAAYVAIDYHTAGMRSPDVYWVDAVEFAGATAEPGAGGTEQLQAALELYRADFLEGFYVRDAPAFETWMRGERERLHESMLQCLSLVAGRYAAAGELSRAIACMRRLLELEPWREEAHRQLMMWLAQSGQRNAALLQYEVCCRALAEELGVEPEEATRELHARLLRTDASPQAIQPPTTVVEYALVGRRLEWQALRATWSSVAEAGAHMVCIGGEAGIGKTRLAEELLIDVQRQGHVTARARAYALEGRLAYAPLAEWLRTPPLQARLAIVDKVWLSEVARLLPELLIQYPDLPAPAPLTERWQQKRLFEALRYVFTAETRPLLLLLDDLQWCDAETLAFLQYLVETAPQVPLLVVGTVRSDEIPEDHALHQLRRALLRAERLTAIDMSFLSAEATTALAAEVREEALDSGAAARLYQATAGNPLFVVETVRAGGSSAQPTGEASLHTLAPADPQLVVGLPPKVYAVIEGRLAQLSSTTRMLAQVAATIGRAFTLPLLAEASREGDEVVVAGLDELWQRRIVREQGGGRYDFTHDRIRDVAYAVCSPVKREHLHRRVAQALEKLHADELDSIAGELGTHYQHAGAWGDAFAWYCRAAEVAKQLYAHNEEIDYLQKAIETIPRLPANSVTAATEIDLWLDLGFACGTVRDWGDISATMAWQKAADLAAQAGNVQYRCRVLAPLTVVCGIRGQWHQARALGELALSLAQQTDDSQLLAHEFAHYGTTLYHFGEFAQALAAFHRHSTFVSTPAELAHTWLGGSVDSRTFLYMTHSIWLLGFPDRALAYGRELVAVRHRQGDFGRRTAGLGFAGMFYSSLCAVSTVQILGEELIAFCVENDYPWFAMWGRMLLGWALAQQGDVQQGLSLVRMGREDERRRGIRDLEPYNRSLFAETLARAGEWEEALDEVTTALTDAEQSGNCFWNAHLLKLQGDFLQALSFSAVEVEACYQRAIATARRQGAKTLELRATTSLARLWQGQGRLVEARQALLEIYGWFTEGFDTVDLLEAKALLDEL